MATTYEIIGYGEVGPCECCGYGEYRRLAETLFDLGELGYMVHINSDDGFGSCNYIAPIDKSRVAKELRVLGGNPDNYRCLKGWESPYADG